MVTYNKLILGSPVAEIHVLTPTSPVHSTQECSLHLAEIDHLTSRNASLANQLVKKELEVSDLKEKLAEKEDFLRSYAKVNQDLKRTIQETGWLVKSKLNVIKILHINHSIYNLQSQMP